MGYVGSYVWKVRQAVGDMRLLTATVDVLVVNSDGKVKLAYAEHVGGWSIVGGHVEYGDSWASAALSELREEAGIIAEKQDLVPWATISGPGRIYHYQDGTTQPFTLVFLIKNWTSEGEQEDKGEVSKTGWFTVDEALDMKITRWLRRILLAYRQYETTGQFQMIEEDYEPARS